MDQGVKCNVKPSLPWSRTLTAEVWAKCGLANSTLQIYSESFKTRKCVLITL